MSSLDYVFFWKGGVRLKLDVQGQRGGRILDEDGQGGCGVCITASGNNLASGNNSLKLFMAPYETIELLII